jgi:proline racemase
VTFRNVPSFVYLKDGEIEVPGMACVQFDIAYGGAFYALVDAHSLGLSLTSENFIALIDAGRRIKHAIAGALDVSHPYEKDLSFLYGVIFTGPPLETHHHSRNVCIFAEGEVDRSATGSGVSARAALHYARGDLELNQTIIIESILGSTMSVTASVMSHKKLIRKLCVQELYLATLGESKWALVERSHLSISRQRNGRTWKPS